MSRSFPQQPSATPSPELASNAWPVHAQWTIQLVRSLFEDASRDPRPLPQRLVESIASHFGAEGMLRLIRVDAGGVSVGLAQYQSAPLAELARAVDLVAATEFVDTLELADGRLATLTLRRPESSQALSPFECRWITVVHAGCAWIYAPAVSDARQRIDRLSPRERQALEQLMRGASEKEVAFALGRSRHTVHSYVKRIYRTLGVRSRSQLRAALGDAINDVLAEPVREQTDDDDSLTTSAG